MSQKLFEEVGHRHHKVLLSLLLWSKAKGVLLLWQKLLLLLLSSFFSKKAKVHIDTKL